MQSALDSLQKLKQGNARYLANQRDSSVTNSLENRHEHAASQQPFAIVLGCSDSRVPVEHVFDQGIGDIFVVRVAGNIATPTQIASIEFAVHNFGSPLIVVLGHSSCGAVVATLNALTEVETAADSAEDDAVTPDLSSLVPSISAAIEPVVASAGGQQAMLNAAIRANVTYTANRLRTESPLLKEKMSTQTLLIVGAEYSLETGAVDFFDGIPT